MRTTLFVILGYLSGSVLYAHVFSKLMGKGNIFEQSKDQNPGTANAFQYGDFWCGFGTLAGDVLKGFFPVWLFLRGADAPASAIAFSLVVAAPVVGHAFPIFFRFQGGKGIAVTFGCLLGLLPVWRPFAFFVGSFLFFSLIIRITPHFQRTIIAYVSALLCLCVSGQPGELLAAFLLITGVVCLRLHMSKEPRERMRVLLFLNNRTVG